MLRLLAPFVLIACLPAMAAQDDKRLPALFEQLAAATDAQLAKPIEEKIWAIWAESKSPTTELLTSRAQALLLADDVETAFRLLETATALNPDHAEGWHLMATVQEQRGKTAEAITALGRTLSLEPRHFGALLALGALMESMQNDKAALAAYDAALKIYPLMEGLDTKVKSARRKVEGDKT